MVDALGLSLAGLAAVAAGFVNALAGGGTLITFPVLIAVGLPPLVANVTNTVALCPGYIGAVVAQAKDLRGQRRRLLLLLPAGAVGGLIGGLLLLNTSERTFVVLVPFLILLASGLLAVQEPLRRWLTRRAEQTGVRVLPRDCVVLPVIAAAVYGGYFGAGLSVIVLAALGLLLHDTLTRLNVLKQSIAFSVNAAAAILFAFSGQVVWSATVVMAAGALLGGALGGRLAGWIRPGLLRGLIVVVGLVVGVIYLLRL